MIQEIRKEDTERERERERERKGRRNIERRACSIYDIYRLIYKYGTLFRMASTTGCINKIRTEISLSY